MEKFILTCLFQATYIFMKTIQYPEIVVGNQKTNQVKFIFNRTPELVEAITEFNSGNNESAKYAEAYRMLRADMYSKKKAGHKNE